MAAAEGTVEYPLISVLVPCYNRERYIEETLLSILEQDYPNFELIVVDDGSQDASVERIQALQQRFDFQFYRQANQGVSAALNTALRHARGELVATPDSDDIMMPGRLSLQANYMTDHPEVGCLGGRVVYIDADGKRLKGEQRNGIRSYSFDDLLGHAIAIGATVAMYRREAIERVGGYDPEIRIQDFQMTLKIAHLGYRVEVLPDVVSGYRRHDGNFSKTAYRRQFDYDCMTVAPYRDHPAYLAGMTCIVNKALKQSVVGDKAYAWSLLLQLPPWRWNRVTWRRIRHLLFKFG
ncbi:glycosyltransferase [Pseudomonas sp. PSE14]|uniref:glycosyltransferase family 2 protein n=1 Tax=Pseudomonas sp. PSE14 TaxID=3016341 RepID=UPI0023D839FE|nr:glycosyltransferase [Pseudomonas sp. PSE14]WEJ71756.1 glycosyltransferase [Pseudomonas sp. PSE14]